LLINVPSQLPDGQLQKQHHIQTQITKVNEQDTRDTGTDKTKRGYLNN